MDKVSFVIPCFRSEVTLEHVVTEIRETMKALTDYCYEIVLVNDCSPDNTLQVIEGLCKKYDNITGVSLVKNFGQHAALMAGFRHVTGDIVVCLDDDGQTPADEVGKFLAEIKAGRDVVYAKYTNKQHTAFRNFGSKVNEIMTRFMLGKPKELYISSYFAAKRFVIDEVVRYRNCYPYVIGLVLRTTKNIGNVEVTHRQREVGCSGYTLKALFALWLCAGSGFLYGIYTIIKRLFIPDVPMGFSSLMSVLVFIGGMIMLMLGLIGEYVGRIYISLNNSPQYVIREIIRQKESEDGL